MVRTLLNVRPKYGSLNLLLFQYISLCIADSLSSISDLILNCKASLLKIYSLAQLMYETLEESQESLYLAFLIL